MTTFARGTYAKAFCRRCGLPYNYDELVDDGQIKGQRVCSDCFDPSHPQERPKRPTDPIALRKPSPERAEGPSEVVFPIYLVDLGVYFGDDLARWTIGQPGNFPNDTGTISLSSSTYTMGTGDTSVVVTAVRSGSFMGATYATYTVTDAHGVVVPVPPGQFVWGEGDSANKTLTLTRAQNCAYDVTVTLSDPAPLSTLGSPSSATVSVAYDHSAANPDPHFSSVVSLLHFNSSFVDQAGVVWAGNGNAQISSAQSKFGGASLLLDGIGDFLSAASAGTLSVGLMEDYTMEAWIYPRTVAPGKYNFIFGGDLNEFAFYLVAGKLELGMWAISGIISAPTHPIPANAQTHVAVSRQAGVNRLFVNGSLANSNTTAYAISYATGARIGKSIYAGAPSNNDFDGYIDDFRFTKGVARYVCDFTPPANQFRDS